MLPPSHEGLSTDLSSRRNILFRKGMTTSKHMEDAYWDRGLGYFVMSHKGILW